MAKVTEPIDKYYEQVVSRGNRLAYAERQLWSEALFAHADGDTTEYSEIRRRLSRAKGCPRTGVSKCCRPFARLRPATKGGGDARVNSTSPAT
jgi:hypothetical protein